MPEAPLQPFNSPLAIFSLIPAGISGASTSIALLGVVTLCWVVYTIVAIYHWVRYSHASLIAVPAIATHIIVSLILIGYALSGVVAL